jgi:hypothetical protein
MRCVGPSATRTRIAAKRAVRRPFVPRRQVTVRHASEHALRRDRLVVRDMPLSRATADGNREDQRHIGGMDFLMAWNADSPLQTALTECVPEWCAQAIAGKSLSGILCGGSYDSP